ncbi:MAG: 23S rRNA (cytidine(2498)-2'-O)-methyltransferase RlmM, partial [Magnetococcales bacterium]|nr:23S rRNA (cytidine(2498)-2'-O)-methyltransferase RlmM [Magnetococcales bacterium]
MDTERMGGVFLYCRAGFEGEALAEWETAAGKAGLSGHGVVEVGSGCVMWWSSG